MSRADNDLAGLSAVVGLEFRDPSLLRRAMAHRSWCAENDEPDSNERLEFLGDAVLGLIVSDYVFRCFPELPEGSLSEVRAGVVNSETLADVAESIGLGDYILLGRGEDGAGGRRKQSILADSLEALIAAIYVDAGIEVAREVVLGWLEARIQDSSRGPGGRDYKTRLQEVAARAGVGRPRYEVVGEGPDHAKRFHATAYLDGRAVGTGTGRSKKQAEQAAALVAYELVAAAIEGEVDAGAA